jgi:hypothetical protein
MLTTVVVCAADEVYQGQFGGESAWQIVYHDSSIFMFVMV